MATVRIRLRYSSLLAAGPVPVVADFFLLRFLSVRLLPQRRVLGHLMLQGRVRQVSRMVLRRAYV
jgi:hypothetical protein